MSELYKSRGQVTLVRDKVIVIRQLKGMSIDTLHDTFIRAFADYTEPFNLSLEQLKYMIERRGCNLDLSFGAFDKNELVGFILNGIGEWNGILTAYDTGTGVIKKYRQKGVATRLFGDSLPVLRDYNIAQYLLEVIRTNKKAYDLYVKAGFIVTREFDYYTFQKEAIEIEGSKLNDKFTIEEINNPDWKLFKTFWDFAPSWQNSIESINRKLDYFKILGIFDNGRTVGYGVIEKDTGDIPQLGIDKEYRQKGLSTTLLNSLLHYSTSDVIKIINIEADYAPFKKFADSLNLTPGLGQYEMLLEL